MNDPDVQTTLNTRGKNVPGINFQLEEGKGSGAVDLSTGEFIPGRWAACNDEINNEMRRDHPVSVIPALKDITKHIRVLLYSGEFDLNCNFIGTLNTLEDNLWDGRQWKEASRALYVVDGDGRGMHYQLGKLSFLIVKNSGHLLPMDQPAVALDMISRFLEDESFADLPLPTADKYEGVHIPSAFEETEKAHNIPQEDSLAFTLLVMLAGIILGVIGSKYYPILMKNKEQY
ncbi:unnamed protein product, partial [Symbiodinium microadriaticum]